MSDGQAFGWNELTKVVSSIDDLTDILDKHEKKPKGDIAKGASATPSEILKGIDLGLSVLHTEYKGVIQIGNAPALRKQYGGKLGTPLKPPVAVSEPVSPATPMDTPEKP